MWRLASALSSVATRCFAQQNRNQELTKPQLLPCLLLLLLLTGCTNADLARFLITPAPVANGADAIDPASASANRLLVQAVDGNLFTINPDGTERFDLTTDASRSRTYSQAT